MGIGGGTYTAVDAGPQNAWQFPFRVIGLLGLVWIVLWYFTIPRWMIQPTEGQATVQGATNFRDVLRDKRFWVLLAMVIAINVTWHGYRTWLPLYLQKQRGFTEAAMARFTTAYYLIADVGSWTVGLLTLWMCGRGVGVHTARVLAFVGCAGLTLCSLAVPFLPNGVLATLPLFGYTVSVTALEVGLLAVAFGALGLFPTYFAFSQELSSKHQGKVTGTLGASAHIALAIIYPIEGFINKKTGTYEYVLGGIGVCPLLALALMLWKWPPRSSPNSPA
jgi:ACS family hexuronate transporter-like MFS transporter